MTACTGPPEVGRPAAGRGQSTCGDVSYAQSVIDGVAAVASQVNTFNTQCPNTILVLVGYSQVRVTYETDFDFD